MQVVDAGMQCPGARVLEPSLPTSVTLNDAQSADVACHANAAGLLLYTFTTTEPHTVVINAADQSFAHLELRKDVCNTGELVTCVNWNEDGGTSRIRERNLPAGTYFLAVAPESTGVPMTLLLDLQAPVRAPMNDSCSTPEVVTLTDGIVDVTGTLEIGTADYVATCSDADGADAVYEVTIPAGKKLNVLGTGARADIALFARGPSCTETTDLACVDNEQLRPEMLDVDNSAGASPMKAFVFIKAYRAADQTGFGLRFTLQ